MGIYRLQDKGWGRAHQEEEGKHDGDCALESTRHKHNLLLNDIRLEARKNLGGEEARFTHMETSYNNFSLMGEGTEPDTDCDLMKYMKYIS